MLLSRSCLCLTSPAVRFAKTFSSLAIKSVIAPTKATEKQNFPIGKLPTVQAATAKHRPFTSGEAEYDVLIVGGGITGSALLYELAKFTDVKSIALVDRRPDFGSVASGANNNSQTIHCGDIETNYTIEKAASVRRHADLLRNYGTKLPTDVQNKCIYKMQKMVLAVGEDECSLLEERFHIFKELFPKMELASKATLRHLEPNVVRISNHRDRKDEINAIVVRNEHSAVNYYYLTHSFIKQAQEAGAFNKLIEVKSDTEVKNIVQNSDRSYSVETSQGRVKAKFVVVSACGYSLLMAQQLGYGLKYACFPVAGSFYFTKTPVLNGKVYTVQEPKLPFSAVHGDPDVQAQGLSRFGPTALPLPLLERFNIASFKDFVKVSNFDLKLVQFFLKFFSDPVMVKYAYRNILFEIPYFGVRKFCGDTQKIVPGMTPDNLLYAVGYGGIRPQLIDKKLLKLILGEGKIVGDNIVFNVTPSPGGTTCLGTAEADMREICKALGANVNDELFRRNLLEGEYAINY